MKKILILALGMFSLGMDTYIVAGLIPEMSRSLNQSSTAIGQGVTIFTLVFAISAPLFSIFLAKINVKQTLIFALIIFIFANIMTSLAVNLPIYLLARAIAGVGAGIFSPMAVSTGSQLVENKNRGKALATVVGGMSIGTVIGVPLGIQISNLTSWRVTLLFIVLISTLTCVLIAIHFRAIFAPTPPSIKERFKLFIHPHIIRIMTVTVCAAIASLGLYTYLSKIVEQYQSIYSLTTYLMMWGIGGLIGSFSIGFIIDRFKFTNLIVLSIMILLLFSFILLPISIHTPIASCLPFLLWGAMGWATQAPQQHILIKNYKSYGETAVALNSSVNYLGSSIGSALCGSLLFITHNINMLVYLSIFICSIGLLVQLANILIDKKQSF
ncbi:MFS transporter [Staphylococcus capitis]|uniref:MFS transporter n=1 Tax=Staphylococcus TaxID=1279 RepID=UPI00019294C6|nr:MFS transporter [Staphylococcus capitis]EEE49050.1 transporter, major facilitator family protein [Staphylococcus capitis SK14]EGS39619.1 transporter, major facilitator family protein [Staphylococcus capitis VCU116]MBN6785255.1 MFS transporter [Staphylococcus capitis]MCT2014699.1 MFS transporter [Staphylococcus capitis]MEB5629220.1 MFS transporter [Staphylococcus capitis]